jgi:hypothetical protein
MFCFWIFSLSRILMATPFPVSVFTAYFTLRRAWFDAAGEAVGMRRLQLGVDTVTRPPKSPQSQPVGQAHCSRGLLRQRQGCLLCVSHIMQQNVLSKGALAQRAANLVLPDFLHLSRGEAHNTSRGREPTEKKSTCKRRHHTSKLLASCNGNTMYIRTGRVCGGDDVAALVPRAQWRRGSERTWETQDPK